jgi:thiosulfate/3-mercaptopyruvate sulfurtransferase
MLLKELSEIEDLLTPVVWVDARIEADYVAGHIPGAIHFDSFEFPNDLTDGVHLGEVVDTWRQMFCQVGIPFSGSVVFYDIGTENRASRPAFMLHYLGHQNSYVLDGGMAAWLDEGGEVSVESSILPKTQWNAIPIDERVDVVLGVDSVIGSLGDERVILLDVRDEPEFLGIRQMEANPRLGRIPGAKGYEWTRFLTRRVDYPKGAGTSRNDGYIFEHLRPGEEIRAQLSELGIEELDTDVIVYCQKSHRASFAYVAMKELGYTNVKVYIGSFREWSKRLDLPLEI